MKEPLNSPATDIKHVIVALEKRALELWNNGDPDGFLDLAADDVVYIDPALARKLEGKKALEEYYNTVRGKIRIDRYEMINPTVQLSAEVAILAYGYEVYRDDQLLRMNCTEVYREGKPDRWKIIHTHWSFTK